MINHALYPYLGPDDWYRDYPVCGHSHQSPINIDTDKVIEDPNLSLLELSGYSQVKDVKMTLENNGHTGQYGFSKLLLWEGLY